VGRERALNLALAEAKADLVANIDADDESHPCRLRCRVQAMRPYRDYSFVFTKAPIIYDAAPPSWPELDTRGSLAGLGRHSEPCRV
jgi:glycosyltransferase involved in cell wall biosynthesis